MSMAGLIVSVTISGTDASVVLEVRINKRNSAKFGRKRGYVTLAAMAVGALHIFRESGPSSTRKMELRVRQPDYDQRAEGSVLAGHFGVASTRKHEGQYSNPPPKCRVTQTLGRGR